MRTHFSLVTLAAVGGLLWLAAPPPKVAAPSAASSAPGGWTTGSTGALGDVVYGPGAHVIDLATEGAYDPVNWMVVFDFQTLTVESGATITFTNHPTRAPVVFRALGNVVIDGTIVLDGVQGHGVNDPPGYAEPGPGGFRGGRGRHPGSSSTSAGFGPGGGFLPSGSGGAIHGGNASHRTVGSSASSYGPPGPRYGSPAALPLVGGSGAAAGNRLNYGGRNSGGGAGGGAIAIGSDTHIELRGEVLARGGFNGFANSGDGTGTLGSGGQIRLVAPVVEQLGGTLDARGSFGATQYGGDGVVRVEVDGALGFTWDGMIFPDPPSVVHSLGEFMPDLPTVSVASVWDPDAMGGAGDWVSVEVDPEATIFPAVLADVQLTAGGTTVFRIEGHDVPLGAPLLVRVTHTRGQATIDETHTMGEVAGSTLATSWTDVTLDLADGVSAVQVRAELP